MNLSRFPLLLWQGKTKGLNLLNIAPTALDDLRIEVLPLGKHLGIVLEHPVCFSPLKVHLLVNLDEVIENNACNALLLPLWQDTYQ